MSCPGAGRRTTPRRIGAYVVLPPPVGRRPTRLCHRLGRLPRPLAGKQVTLHVAVLAPISWRVPPRHYGPWEQFASLLTEGLVARGVDVTLFATGDSATAARLASVTPRGWSEDGETSDAKVLECL